MAVKGLMKKKKKKKKKKEEEEEEPSPDAESKVFNRKTLLITR